MKGYYGIMSAKAMFETWNGNIRMIYIGLLGRMICICARYEVVRSTLGAASMYPEKIRATSSTQVC